MNKINEWHSSPDGRESMGANAQPHGEPRSQSFESDLDATLQRQAIARRQIATMREPAQLTDEELDERRIIHTGMSSGYVVDAFREIRTKLLELSRGRNFMVQVAAVQPGGGGSFTATNLAACFAFDESKTSILIDCNLSRPCKTRRLAPDDKPGVTDYLESPDMPLSSIIYPTGIKRLRLIPAGHRCESPAEFLGSAKMRHLLASLRQRYSDRFLVIDSPAATQSADYRILTEISDFVILVVPYGKTNEAKVNEAVRAIDPTKFVGCVFGGQPSINSYSKPREVL